LPRPWEADFAKLQSPELQEIRDALRADAAIRYGHMDSLNGAHLTAAASLFRKHNMPRHADMMEGIVENGRIVLRPELRPAFRTRYEELQEEAPHVALLRYLMEHEELLKPGEAQP